MAAAARRREWFAAMGARWEAMEQDGREEEAEEAAAAAEAAEEAAAAGPARRRRRMNDYSSRRKEWKPDFYDFFSALEFRRTYGLNHQAFDYVLRLIRDKIVDEPSRRGGARNGKLMAPELKLAITLRWLRGGSPHDIKLAYGCSKSQVYVHRDRVLNAIASTPELGFELPAALDAYEAGDARRLERLGEGFGRFTSGLLTFIIGAIDGVQISIRRPAGPNAQHMEAPNPNAFVDRKGHTALNVQAIADHRGKIIWWASDAPGSMHDAQAFSLSRLAPRLTALIGGRFCLIGDDAYTSAPTMWTPVRPPPDPGTPEDDANYFQSLTRQPVERAFGMIERRWGVLCAADAPTRELLPARARRLTRCSSATGGAGWRCASPTPRSS